MKFEREPARAQCSRGWREEAAWGAACGIRGSYCQRQQTKTEPAAGKEACLCSSGFSGRSGRHGLRHSFASGNPEPELCCQEVGCGQEPDWKWSGGRAKGSTLAGSLLSSHGLTEGFWAALPRSPRPLVSKELIAACPGGSLPCRAFLVDRNIGTWMLGSCSKNAWFRGHRASNAPFLIKSQQRGPL